MDKDIAIKVDHVSMHFNMASEKIESMKEYFIKALKKQLFFKDFVAVDDASFEIKKGEVFGIVGTNGSGKSTLLKIVSGILTPTTGEVTVKGTIAPLIELGAGFDGDLTARENIFLNGAILGYEKEFIEEKFASIVDFAELWDFLDMPIKNYSSGMVARIAFAIATVVKPDVLIVDEILAVGDFMFQQKCEQRIRELMSEGTTVVIVSHSIDQIESLCDRVLWIEKSKTKMIGPTFEVCNAYRNLQNEREQENSKEYQIVAHEKCRICGEETDFRNEPGMTYNVEAFCSHCGASIRVSDMMGAYLDRVQEEPDACMAEKKDLFKDYRIFTSSNRGALHAFFGQYENYMCMDGNFSERCRKLESEEYINSLPYDFDIFCIEELFMCVDKPVEVLKRIAEHIKPGGKLLLTFQLYENETTELNKHLKHNLYWTGTKILNKWGEKDVVDVINSAGFQAEKIQGHKWYDSDEIIEFGEGYEELMTTHPFYFYKFNTWVIVADRNV